MLRISQAMTNEVPGDSGACPPAGPKPGQQQAVTQQMQTQIEGKAVEALPLMAALK